MIKISKDKKYPVIFGLNEDVVALSLVSFYDGNDERTEKYMVSNIKIKAVVFSKNNPSSDHDSFLN